MDCRRAFSWPPMMVEGTGTGRGSAEGMFMISLLILLVGLSVVVKMRSVDESEG